MVAVVAFIFSVVGLGMKALQKLIEEVAVGHFSQMARGFCWREGFSGVLFKVGQRKDFSDAFPFFPRGGGFAVFYGWEEARVVWGCGARLVWALSWGVF